MSKRRDRRVRYRVEELGVQELVDALLAKGVTYEEIEQRLRESGHEIGKSSIARYNQNVQRKLRKITALKETAQAMTALWGERSGGEPDTQMSELLIGMVQSTLLDKLGDDELSVKDAVGLSLAGSQAVRAASALEKTKTDERARFARAWERVLAESRKLLEGEPGLWPRVEAVLLRGKREALAEPASG